MTKHIYHQGPETLDCQEQSFLSYAPPICAKLVFPNRAAVVAEETEVDENSSTSELASDEVGDY